MGGVHWHPRRAGFRVVLVNIHQNGTLTQAAVGATMMRFAVNFPKHLKMDIFTDKFNFQTPAILTEQINREPH